MVESSNNNTSISHVYNEGPTSEYHFRHECNSIKKHLQWSLRCIWVLVSPTLFISLDGAVVFHLFVITYSCLRVPFH